MGQPSIFRIGGGPVVDVDGFAIKIVANYRDKQSTAPTDHSANGGPLAFSPLSLVTAGFSGIGPLNTFFDGLWHSVRGQANERVIKQISQQGGTWEPAGTGGAANPSGLNAIGLPNKGTLYALARPEIGQPLFLSYWLPNAKFLFHYETGDWILTFDSELFVQIPLSNWPTVPAFPSQIPLADWPTYPQIQVNFYVSDANISADGLGATLDEGLLALSNFFSGDFSNFTDNLFSIQEGQIDSTTGAVPTQNLLSLQQGLAALIKACFPLGFTQCGVFIGASPADTLPGGMPSKTINIRLIHPVDVGPTVTNADIIHGVSLVTPTVTLNSTQTWAGKGVTVRGQAFPPAQAKSTRISWNDTISGSVHASEIKWSSGSHTPTTVNVPRQPFDSKNIGHVIDGLDTNRTYSIQVRDADLLTYTDWSKPLPVQTTGDSVDIKLHGGSTNVLLKSAAVTSDGTFAISVQIPDGTAPGAYEIVATAGSSSASAAVQILKSGESATQKLYEVFPDKPVKAGYIQLQGEGFQAGSVKLAIEGGKSLGTGTANTNGIFTVAVPLPSEAGTYSILASQQDGSTTLRATFTCDVQPQPK